MQTKTYPNTKAQNKALCLICAVFSITLIYVLELEASIPFLSIYFNSLTRHTAICFNELSINNHILQ